MLQEGEEPTGSLIAGLFGAARPDLLGPASSASPGGTQKKKGRGTAKATATASFPSSHPVTVYTPNLTLLAQRIVGLHNDDPNAAQVQLINLLFRSVGGTNDVTLDPATDVLENMNDEDWGAAVTDLVDDMRRSEAAEIAICADPRGARAGAGGSAAPSATSAAVAGPAEYRRIYEEFWYVLGTVALTEGGMANQHAIPSAVSDDEDDNDNDNDNVNDESTSGRGRRARGRKRAADFPVAASTVRYDAELVRELVTRVIELASVGQPDVRAGAVVAAYRMGHAVLDRTVHLGDRLEVAERQLAAASKRGGGGSAKVEALQHQVDSLRRTRSDLESILSGPVVNGVFIHRYRDSNLHIRALSMESLSVMTLQRPDLYLADKYLKYFGWMLSDKEEKVRLSALSGLLAPYLAVRAAARSADSAVIRHADQINLDAMTHVVTKFLNRLIDCIIDRSVAVQEKAMELLLILLQEGILDDVEDDSFWEQVNVRALDPGTSPRVRRDALYFVTEQLETFDNGEEEDGGAADAEEDSNEAAAPRQKGGGGTTQSSDRRIAVRLDSLASWTAHALTDGDIPLDEIRIGLADYVVYSLRSMPEHRNIVTTWSAMLQAIGDDNAAMSMQGTAAGDRADEAKQRVLVQMLTVAARAEVGAVADSSFFDSYVDPDVVEIELASKQDAEVAGASKVSKKSGSGMQHERLSIALLKALPNLLLKFKGDSAVLASLASLPRYLLPSAFSLPQRKRDFLSLAKNLADAFLQSTDRAVLENIALSMRYLSDGDHSRAADGHLQVKNICKELQDRIVDLFTDSQTDVKRGLKRNRRSSSSSNKRTRRGRSSSASLTSSLSDEEGGVSASTKSANIAKADTESAIYLNLMRLHILYKRCDLTSYLRNNESSSEDDKDNGIEVLCSIIADGLARRLKSLKLGNDVASTQDDDASSQEVSPWAGDRHVMRIIAQAIDEGMNVILTATSWKVHSVIEEEELVVEEDDDVMHAEEENDEKDENAAEDHLVVRLRDRIVALAELCFDHFLDESLDEDDVAPAFTKAQLEFSMLVQSAACAASADLRTLFPKELADAKSSLLRAFAIKDDGRLIGGFVRFFRSQETRLREKNDADNGNMDIDDGLLLPMSRTLAMTWTQGNRREAGVALAHITGSGQQASSLVSSLAKTLKKTDPVRLLEAQMACLRQSFDDWLENEPEEPDSDYLTDDQLNSYQEAEKIHIEQYSALERQAARLSQTLGVGKVTDARLVPALLGFVREGVRFAFSHNDDEDDYEWGVGVRLSFLHLLGKYANWVKKNRQHMKILQEDIDEKEAIFREHPEFDQVHEDDLGALQKFCTDLGLKRRSPMASSKQKKQVIHETDDDDSIEEDSDQVSPSPTSSGRNSRESATMSRVSAVSGMRSLSPLEEEKGIDQEDASGGESDDEDLSVPRRTRSSYGSRKSRAITGASQATYDPY